MLLKHGFQEFCVAVVDLDRRHAKLLILAMLLLKTVINNPVLNSNAASYLSSENDGTMLRMRDQHLGNGSTDAPSASCDCDVDHIVFLS